MTNDLNTITIKIQSSVKPEIRKYQAYANTLKDYLLKDDFLRILQGWKFTPEMIEDLESVMLRYPRYSLNTKQMEWLDEYRSSIVAPDDNVTTNKPCYSDDLIKLFHGNTYLIEQLNGKSDVEIARLIKKWAKEKDGLGKPLIDNPDNYGYKTKFADALLRNRIVENKNFRIKL